MNLKKLYSKQPLIKTRSKTLKNNKQRKLKQIIKKAKESCKTRLTKMRN